MRGMNEMILVFGGATEGRRICQFLKSQGLPFILSVATAYGKETADRDFPIFVRRMDEAEMVRFYQSQGIGFVIDATHPYAVEATENIRRSCEKMGMEWIRILRPALEDVGGVAFSSHGDAAQYLDREEGNIFLSIGSKEIGAYANIKDFSNRVYARILPMSQSIDQCLSVGMKSAHLLCMQGPFSMEMNMACFQMAQAKFLVTKDSGDKGGVANKLAAAKALGMKTVIIGRPVKEEGLTLEEAISYLSKKWPVDKVSSRKFPVFISLEGKKILVLGGGNIAGRRIEKLLAFSPNITVISPGLNNDLMKLHDEGKIIWQKRKYQQGDLSGFDLVLAATDNRQVNHDAAKEAKEKGMLISVADKREEGSFWFPAVVEADGLIYGVISPKGDHEKVKEAAGKLKNSQNR